MYCPVCRVLLCDGCYERMHSAELREMWAESKVENSISIPAIQYLQMKASMNPQTTVDHFLDDQHHVLIQMSKTSNQLERGPRFYDLGITSDKRPLLVGCVGRSAVGKSFIIKMLCEQKDARLAPIPGQEGQTLSTSSNLHLYNDSASQYTDAPIPMRTVRDSVVAASPYHWRRRADFGALPMASLRAW